MGLSRYKLIAFLILLVIALLYATAFIVESNARSHVVSTILQSQDRFTDVLASSLNQRMMEDKEFLKNAQSLAVTQKVSPAHISSWIAKRIVLNKHYTIGYGFISAHGTIEASQFRIPLSGIEHEIRSAVLSLRQTTICYPFRIGQNGRVGFIYVLPIKTETLNGYLFGINDTFSDTTLASVLNAKMGDNGYTFIFDSSRRIIVHPNPSRVLERDIEPGDNLLLDRALNGFEGSGETVNSRGVTMLSSFRKLQINDWYIGVNFPKQDALLPLKETRPALHITMLLAFLAVFATTALFIRRITGSVTALKTQVETLAGTELHTHLSLNTKDEELDTLTASFNKVLTTLKEREQELAKNKKLFEIISNSAQDVILFRDANMKIVYVSPAFETVFEVPVSVCYEDPEYMNKLVIPDDLQVLKRHKGIIERRQSNHPIQFRVKTVSGAIKWIEHVCSPVYDDNGTFIGVRASNREITRQKQYQEDLRGLTADLASRVHKEAEKLRQQEQILIQQSRLAAMGEMIGAIAHQWRQPLNVIGMMVQDLEDAEEFGELNKVYLKETVEKVMHQISYMSHTIDDFREYFKPTREKVRFDLRTTIAEALYLLHAMLNNSHITLSFRMECGESSYVTDNIMQIPLSGGENFFVTGYPNEFKQVIINVLSNARDAIIDRRSRSDEQFQGEIVVTLADTNDGRYAIIIQDNAGGIPEDILPKIFEPYFTTKEEKGTGIGLYMARSIIENNMQGHITADNAFGGARFTIHLNPSR